MTYFSICIAYCQTLIRRTIKDERGASLVEYALLLALIAVVCIGAITLIGEGAKEKLSEVSSELD
jgi:pilus assembly protein Flp/PilA